MRGGGFFMVGGGLIQLLLNWTFSSTEKDGERFEAAMFDSRHRSLKKRVEKKHH